jgi:hypothetical protein
MQYEILTYPSKKIGAKKCQQFASVVINGGWKSIKTVCANPKLAQQKQRLHCGARKKKRKWDCSRKVPQLF